MRKTISFARSNSAHSNFGQKIWSTTLRESFGYNSVPTLSLSRRCKLTTTGPWLLITPTVKLRDVSVQIDEVVSDDDDISVWVVGSQGDVLYRHGVTKACPQVFIAFYIYESLFRPCDCILRMRRFLVLHVRMSQAFGRSSFTTPSVATN